MKKIGFIGCGNMGGAILGGILKSGLFKPEEVAASDAFETAANAVREQFSVDACTENRAVAENSEIVLLSVKPQFYAAVIAEIRDLIREDQVVVTIAPGWTLKRFRQACQACPLHAEYPGAGGRWCDGLLPKYTGGKRGARPGCQGP